MIQEYIKNLIKEQKVYYISRPDIREQALTKQENEELDKTGIMTNRVFNKLRNCVLGFDGEDANASYDEGYLRSAELLKTDLMNFVKLHIEEIELNPQLSQDYKEGMHEIYKAIK